MLRLQVWASLPLRLSRASRVQHPNFVLPLKAPLGSAKGWQLFGSTASSPKWQCGSPLSALASALRCRISDLLAPLDAPLPDAQAELAAMVSTRKSAIYHYVESLVRIRIMVRVHPRAIIASRRPQYAISIRIKFYTLQKVFVANASRCDP
jgi:hypothetical protein